MASWDEGTIRLAYGVLPVNILAADAANASVIKLRVYDNAGRTGSGGLVRRMDSPEEAATDSNTSEPRGGIIGCHPAAL